MVHYRQGRFHCYILSCVVSGDKRTTILISVRRNNTWLEPMKSALSFCHWLGPSGPNKVFPFESTAVGNYTVTLLLNISVFFHTLHSTLFYGFSLVPDLISAHRTQHNKIWLSRCTCFSCVSFRLCAHALCGGDRRGWPCQSICQWLTVSQHMHYTDGYHHSCNNCPLHWNQKTSEWEAWKSESKGSWVRSWLCV